VLKLKNYFVSKLHFIARVLTLKLFSHPVISSPLGPTELVPVQNHNRILYSLTAFKLKLFLPCPMLSFISFKSLKPQGLKFPHSTFRHLLRHAFIKEYPTHSEFNCRRSISASDLCSFVAFYFHSVGNGYLELVYFRIRDCSVYYRPI